MKYALRPIECGAKVIGHKLSLWRRCQAAILALWPLRYSPTMGVEWSSQADRYVERGAERSLRVWMVA